MLPADAQFTAIGIGRAAFTSVAHSLSWRAARARRPGGCGLFVAGELAPSNAAMVEKARRMVEDLGGQIATPREARGIIGLPARLADARVA